VSGWGRHSPRKQVRFPEVACQEDGGDARPSPVLLAFGPRGLLHTELSQYLDLINYFVVAPGT
jgi:hypothetical protein